MVLFIFIGYLIGRTLGMGRMELMGYWRQHAGASGGSGVSAPGFDLSVQINIHERTDLSRPSSLEYIGGAAQLAAHQAPCVL